jgi:hypothetical protein
MVPGRKRVSIATRARGPGKGSTTRVSEERLGRDYAARSYSWISPPSRSRRRRRSRSITAASGCSSLSGGRWASARCGRCSLKCRTYVTSTWLRWRRPRISSRCDPRPPTRPTERLRASHRRRQRRRRRRGDSVLGGECTSARLEISHCGVPKFGARSGGHEAELGPRYRPSAWVKPSQECTPSRPGWWGDLREASSDFLKSVAELRRADMPVLLQRRDD